MKTFTREQITPAFEALPKIVQDLLFSPKIELDVQKIGVGAGLLIDQLKNLNTLVNYVILGLLSEKAFVDECKQTFSLDEHKANSLGESASREIFAPIRPALVAFFERENTQVPPEEESAVVFARNEATQDLDTGDSVQDVNLLIQPRQSTDSQRQDNVPFVPVQLPMNNDQTPNVPPLPLAPFRVWEREPDIAPDNLPTAEETEPLIPPIPPKTTTSSNESPAHPFEEKMKRVFTAGAQSIEDLSIEPSLPQSAPASTPAPALTTPRPATFDPYREPIE